MQNINSILIDTRVHKIIDNMWNRHPNLFAETESQPLFLTQSFALLCCWILEIGSLPDSRISSSSQMRSSVGDWPLMTVSTHSTAEITNSIFLLTNRASMGLSSSVGQLRFCHPKADQLRLAHDLAASAQAREEGRDRDGAEGGIPELT